MVLFDSWECSLLIDSKAGVDPRFPVLAEFLKGVVQNCIPGLRWTSLRLIRNGLDLMGMEGDEDPAEDVWIVTLGDFQGGGLWIEGEAGEGSVIKQLHCLEPWMGEDLWVVKAFTAVGGQTVAVEGTRDEVEWEIEFPHQVISPEWRKDAVSLHEAALFLQGKLLRKISQSWIWMAYSRSLGV